jgi:hypothetical protein
MNEEAIRTAAILAVHWAEAVPDYTFMGGNDPNSDYTQLWRGIAGNLPNIACAFDTQPPWGVSALVNSQRGVAFFRRAPARYAHRPSEEELQAFPDSQEPDLPPQPVMGVAMPVDGRYHPRRFTTPALSAAQRPQSPLYLQFWPTLQATEIGEAGAVQLNLRWNDPKNSPASWSILTLRCTRDGTTYNFAGQADVNGDVIVPLTGLPPRPHSQTADDVMSYTVRANFAKSGATVVSPEELAGIPISIDGGASFAAQQSLSTPRGGVNKAPALKSNGVAITGVLLKNG